MNTDAKLVLGAIGLVAAFIGTSLGITQYNTVQERKLREKEVENKKLYYSKLTPEQVENLEKQKLEVEKARIELKSTEAELKKTVADFKNDIQQQVETKAMSAIHDDMRSTFDTWAAKFEVRLESKVDSVVSRIDNLSDKYGGVKQASPAAVPSIQVVNAPNN